MLDPWPFDDPPETAVFSLRRILRGESAILLVTHDEDDGSWQFLDGEHVFEADAALLALGEVGQLDPSVLILADLPLGWRATRAAPDRPWERAPDPS